MIYEKNPHSKFDDPHRAPHMNEASHDHVPQTGAAAAHNDPKAAHGPAGESAMQGLFGHLADPNQQKSTAVEGALRSRLDQYFSAWSHYGGGFDAGPAIALYQPNASIEDIAPNMEKLLHLKWQTHYGNAAAYGQAMNTLYNTVASFTMHWNSSGAIITPEAGGDVVTINLSFGAIITTKLVPVHMHMLVHAKIRWVRDGGKWLIASETLHREGMKMPGIGSLNSGE